MKNAFADAMEKIPDRTDGFFPAFFILLLFLIFSDSADLVEQYLRRCRTVIGIFGDHLVQQSDKLRRKIRTELIQRFKLFVDDIEDGELDELDDLDDLDDDYDLDGEEEEDELDLDFDEIEDEE